MRQVTFNDLQRQTYTATVRTICGAAKSQPVTATVDVRPVDEQCPTPSVSVSPSDGSTTIRTATITPNGDKATDYLWNLQGPVEDSGSTSGALTFEMSGLTAGRYTVTVIAKCGDADTDPQSLGATANFVVESRSHNCLTPTGLTGTESEVSTTTWTFAWNPNPDKDGDTPREYRYRISGAHTVEWTRVTSPTVTIPNLRPGTSAIIVSAICASDEGGENESQPTNPYSFHVEDPNTLCPPEIAHPDDFVPDPSQARNVTITWEPCEEGPRPDDYAWRLVSTFGGSTLAQSGDTTETTVSFENLASGEWTFYVKARKQGFKDSAEDFAGFRIGDKPGTPQPRVQVGSDGTSASFDWDAIEAADYYLARLSGEPGKLDSEDRITTTTASASGLAAGKTYTFHVRACRSPAPGTTDPSCGNEGKVDFETMAQPSAPGPPTGVRFGELMEDSGSGLSDSELSTLGAGTAIGSGLGALTLLLSFAAAPVIITGAIVGASAGLAAGGTHNVIQRLLGRCSPRRYSATLSWTAPAEDPTANPPKGAADRYRVEVTGGGRSTSYDVSGTTLQFRFVAGADSKSVTADAKVYAVNDAGESEAAAASRSFGLQGCSPQSSLHPPVQSLRAQYQRGSAGDFVITFRKATGSNPVKFLLTMTGGSGPTPRWEVPATSASNYRTSRRASSIGTYTISVVAQYESGTVRGPATGRLISSNPVTAQVTYPCQPPREIVSASGTLTTRNLAVRWTPGSVGGGFAAAVGFVYESSLASGETTGTSLDIPLSGDFLETTTTVAITIWAISQGGCYSNPTTATLEIESSEDIAGEIENIGRSLGGVLRTEPRRPPPPGSRERIGVCSDTIEGLPGCP